MLKNKSIYLNYVLDFIFTPTDKCGYHPSSKKPLNRKPQLVTTQRPADYGEPNTNGFSIIPASIAQKPSLKRGPKYSRKSAVKHSFLETTTHTGLNNRISVDILRRKREYSWDSI